jgi:hypothetical protein
MIKVFILCSDGVPESDVAPEFVTILTVYYFYILTMTTREYYELS